jgi:hypothetical protein
MPTIRKQRKWKSQQKNKSGNVLTNSGSRTTGLTDGMMSSGIRPKKELNQGITPVEKSETFLE